MAELSLENLKGFDQSVEQQFFQKAVARLKEYYGEQVASGYTQEQLEDFTKLGIKRARANNVTSEGGILDYLLVMSWFGAFFDIDQHYSFLHSHIHLKPEDSLKGKTVHAVYKGEEYEDQLFEYDHSKSILLLLLEEYISSAELVPNSTVTKPSLERAVGFYFPMNRYLIETKGLLEILYTQAAPEEFGFTIQNTQLVWFILMLTQGLRFHHNPLYPEINAVLMDTDQALNKTTQNIDPLEYQRQKLIKIIHFLSAPYAKGDTSERKDTP